MENTPGALAGGVFHLLSPHLRRDLYSTVEINTVVIQHSILQMAPYLGLRGMPLVMAITLACSIGFLLFGK